TIESIGPTATIEGDNSSRTFEIAPSANVSLLGVNIINGDGVANNPLGKHRFTALDVPGAPGTKASGTSNSARTAGLDREGVGDHGYVRRGGGSPALDVAGAPFIGLAAYTWAEGVNDSGQVVGFYGKDGTLHGFLYSGGSYTTLDVPGATGGTEALGVNDS